MTFGGQYPAAFHDVEHLPCLNIVWDSNMVQTRGPQEREWLKLDLSNFNVLLDSEPNEPVTGTVETREDSLPGI